MNSEEEKRGSEAPTRDHFRHFDTLPTRWNDNDVYGHVNNVVYYAFFDTVINRYLITEGGLDIARDPIIGLAVETQCTFTRALAFPDVVEAGLRVVHLGRTSVRYEVGIFLKGGENVAAYGRFTHVFVERATRRPTPIPPKLQMALAAIMGESSPAPPTLRRRGSPRG